MLRGDTSNEFLNQNRFAYARTTEKTCFTAFNKRTQQVHNLDTRLEHFRFGCQIDEFRGFAVNRQTLFGMNGRSAIHGLAEQVEYPAECFFADRHFQRPAGIDYLHPSTHTEGAAQSHRTYPAAAQMLLDFTHQLERLAFEFTFDG